MKSIYDVIVRPVITEKSSAALSANKYTFIVHTEATKIDVRNAVEKLYNVKVTKVNTASYEGKQVRLGKSVGRKADWKKAVVVLAQGQKIDAFTA
jgi:large subunit ribosomal protein L23